MPHSKSSLRAGFTLVEILIVITIIAILMGLVLPVLSKAKFEALKTTDVSNLRQMAIARSLYQESNDDSTGTRIRWMVNAGVVPKAICASPLDQTKEGLADLMRYTADPPDNEHVSYKDSFVPAAEVMGKQTMLDVESSRNGGWLVSLSLCQPKTGPTLSPSSGFQGRYLRLMMDGAVVQRVVIWRPTKDAKKEESSFTWLYTDEVDKF
jgi:prepilin-type N-terminal cleavage/methylation domain-containing protein